MSKKGKISSAQRIAQAAEMYFDGMTQAVIAQKLDLNQSRISQMQSTIVWQETIARLENLKQKAQAEAERQQKLAYSSDFDRRFEQSRQMVGVCATTYSKLMLVINKALDEINKSPAKVDIKILPSLIKSALLLQQEASGRHYDEVEALKILADAGWLPRSVLKLVNDENLKLKQSLREAFAGIIPNYTEEQGRGLTPETAAALRSYLFAIEPADISEISEDVEPGSISN